MHTPESKSAVAEALRAVLAAIADADGRNMVSRRKPRELPPGVDAGPHPEHEAEEMELIQSLEDLHGGEAAEEAAEGEGEMGDESRMGEDEVEEKQNLQPRGVRRAARY